MIEDKERLEIGDLVKLKEETLHYCWSDEGMRNRLRGHTGMIIDTKTAEDNEVLFRILIDGRTYNWFYPQDLEVINEDR